MGFEIVSGSPSYKPWYPVINTDTLYVGQLVKCNNEGVEPWDTASGAGDSTIKTDTSAALIADGGSANNALWGVIIGTNKRVPSFNTTYKAESITYVAPSSATNEDYFGVGGPWAQGDLQAMVQVAPITADTILKAPLFNGAYGTAPTEVSVTTATSTVAVTTEAVDVAPVASLGTIFFRAGANKGAYRITDNTSTTAITWDLPLVSSPTTSDKAVHVNLRTCGMSRMQIDSEATYIDTSAALTSDYHLIDVISLDLSTAGLEHVIFRFNPYTMLPFDDIA